MLKAVLFRELLVQLRWLNKQKKETPKKPKNTVLVMAIVSGGGVSYDPCLLQEPTLVLNWK